MFESWTLGRRLAAGFALPLVILMLLGAFSYQSTQRLMQTSYWVAHTHEVLGSLSRLLSDMQDVETGQRGYALTGKTEFLEPYQAGLGAVEKRFQHLKTLTADNERQQERLSLLLTQLEACNAYATDIVEARRDKGLEAAAALVGEGKGKRLMDAVRKTVDEMVADETELLKVRAAEAETASNRLAAVLLGGTVLAVLLVFAFAVFLVRGLGEKLGSTVQHMRSAAAELEAAATQQVKGAREQVSTVTEVSTTVRELVSTARQIAESAQRVTEVARGTADAARSGDQTVADAQEAVGAVRSEVQKIVDHMLALGRKSQQIGSIVDIINELSEQTNILAINATIESVGAGEAGRRFGVVASEIRKLADRVTASTRDIRRLIDEVRGAANTTVMATEDGAKAVEAGTRRFGEVAESFRRIVEYVGSTAEAAREIEMSTKQQTSAMEQVSSAVADVASTAVQTEASSTQTLRTATELSNLSSSLTRLIRQDLATSPSAP